MESTININGNGFSNYFLEKNQTHFHFQGKGGVKSCAICLYIIGEGLVKKAERNLEENTENKLLCVAINK